MDFKCLECDKEFDTKSRFHLHLKAHALTIGDYYVKHYERKDLYSGEKIPFKSYDQYFRDNFINYDNFIILNFWNFISNHNHFLFYEHFN